MELTADLQRHKGTPRRDEIRFTRWLKDMVPEGDAAMTKIPDARRSAAKMAKDANDSQESGFG